MRKYILIGALAFVVFAVAAMPASVVRLVSSRIDGLVLRAIGGTLWDGWALVAYRGQPIGEFAWRFLPGGLLDGEVRARWRLADADADLSGIAARGLGGGRVTAAGKVGAAAVNRVLGRHDIQIHGTFEASDIAVGFDGAPRVSGTIAWPGGRTIYRLSGQNYDTTLPAMIAEVGMADGEYTLDAKLAERSAAPLIRARLDAKGWLEIGVTRRFTALAGKPWPVAGDADAVVLTIEEQVFR